MTRRDPNEGLPPFALEYLREARSARPALRGFHAWLRRTGRPILQLEAAEIEKFLSPFLAAQNPHAQTRCRRQLFRYFDWLHIRRLLSFNPRRVWSDFSNGRSLFELPDHALRFIKTLEPTLKTSTVAAYRTTLRQFHMWLDAQALSPHALDRNHVAAWLQSLHARKLSAGHRIQVILAVRGYYLWLEEQPDYSGTSADDLFRRGDLPKRPDYLPRPIPADLDHVLQRRLRKSTSTIQLGLLLMRRTGLRLGELRVLPYHCVHTDHLGNVFLKVPLGKLNSERLVPLDRATIRVFKKLQAVGSTGRNGKRRTLLLQSESGKPVAFHRYRLELKQACRGLVFAEPMTSHRLRHTYATSMLAAGVTLPVLMKLLGHRHYQMTLRYAAITPETVANEYAHAAQAIEQRYNISSATVAAAEPNRALTDFARYVLKHAEDNALDQAQARTLVRRLHRLDAAIQRLFRRKSSSVTR
jgi:site-specific recombinase XerD